MDACVKDKRTAGMASGCWIEKTHHIPDPCQPVSLGMKKKKHKKNLLLCLKNCILDLFVCICPLTYFRLLVKMVFLKFFFLAVMGFEPRKTT
jgi:hypothetical protein